MKSRAPATDIVSWPLINYHIKNSTPLLKHKFLKQEQQIYISLAINEVQSAPATVIMDWGAQLTASAWSSSSGASWRCSGSCCRSSSCSNHHHHDLVLSGFNFSKLSKKEIEWFLTFLTHSPHSLNNIERIHAAFFLCFKCHFYHYLRIIQFTEFSILYFNTNDCQFEFSMSK